MDRKLVEQAIEEYQEGAEKIEFGCKDKFLIFDVLLDNRYPQYPPQFFCRSAIASLNDGRDIFKDILKGDWKLTKSLYEMV